LLREIDAEEHFRFAVRAACCAHGVEASFDAKRRRQAAALQTTSLARKKFSADLWSAQSNHERGFSQIEFVAATLRRHFRS
jgi:hypothetical protein